MGWLDDLSSLSGAQPYGTGNIYFNADGTVADGNKVSNANWSVMKYSDDLAFLLNKGWKTMIDPVYGDKLIFKGIHAGRHKCQLSGIQPRLHG